MKVVAQLCCDSAQVTYCAFKIFYTLSSAGRVIARDLSSKSVTFMSIIVHVVSSMSNAFSPTHNPDKRFLA